MPLAFAASVALLLAVTFAGVAMMGKEDDRIYANRVAVLNSLVALVERRQAAAVGTGTATEIRPEHVVDHLIRCGWAEDDVLDMPVGQAAALIDVDHHLTITQHGDEGER